MTTDAEKLLEKMRLSKNGWKPHDLKTLYKGFGFTIKHGGNHDIIVHPKYRNLRATIPRHKFLLKAYVAHAVKLIDNLLALELEESRNDEQPEK